MKFLIRSFNLKRHSLVPLAMIVACSLLALTGCHIPDTRKAKPTQCLPGDYNGAIGVDNSAMLGPNEFFNDPTLISLIDQALVGNQQLRILSEDIQIANNEILRRRGMLFPFFNIGAGAGLEKSSAFTPMGAAERQLTYPGGGNFPDPLPNFLVAADITWQIDIWRQLRNARDAAGLRFLGTQDGLNYVVTRLVADIAENYYTLMALDQQLATLDKTIELQEQSLNFAKARKEAARDTELAVQRFVAEVRKNQSEKYIITQRIIEAENRINFTVGRFPQHVDRPSGEFINLKLQPLQVGVPAQLLQNRFDIRQAERELQASGLDVQVARANFYPKLTLTAGVGYEAFNTKFLFDSPDSLIYRAAGNLVAPVINRSAIKAEYFTANAKQLQAIYEYQRVILNAFTEVVNQISKVENYSQSIEIKKRQLDSLESAVSVSGLLFQNARIEYLDVLTSQRDRNEARMVIIETKKEQLSAIVNAYQALGGGMRRSEYPQGMLLRPIEPAGPNQPPPEEIAAPKNANQPKAPLPPMPPMP